MSLIRRGLGYIPGPSPRAKIIPVPAYVKLHAQRVFAPVATLPSEVSLDGCIADVLDQLAANTCAANSLAQCIRTRAIYQGIKNAELPARDAINWLACSLDGATAKDPTAFNQGTYLHSVITVVQLAGWASEAYWKYILDTDSDDDITAKLALEPDANFQRLAYDQRDESETSAHTLSTADECALALANGYPVQIGGPVSKAYVSNAFDPEQPLPAVASTDVAGGHARMLYGYKTISGKRVFLECGSYGKDFANGGKYVVSEDVLNQADEKYAIEHTATPTS